MYLFSQAVLVLDSSLVDADDYWSSKARKLLNLTVEEVRSLKEFSKCESIRQFVDLNEKVQQTLAQLKVYTELDLSTLTRLYSIPYEKLNYFNQMIAQLLSEINDLPASILQLSILDPVKTDFFLQGYTQDKLTNSLLEGIMLALEQNYRGLTYLALVDCDMDPKRALTLNLILQGDLIRLRHLNFNKNPLLKERGVNSIITTANTFAATEVCMLQFADCGLNAQAAIRISRHLAQPENRVGRNLKLLNLNGDTASFH